MGCHGQIWSDSSALELVRESWRTGRAITWQRVNDVPDHVYFHHGVHSQAGVTCAYCHGVVENMPRVYRAASLTMKFCIDCHRDPPGAANYGYAVTRLTTCSACHR